MSFNAFYFIQLTSLQNVYLVSEIYKMKVELKSSHLHEGETSPLIIHPFSFFFTIPTS